MVVFYCEENVDVMCSRPCESFKCHCDNCNTSPMQTICSTYTVSKLDSILSKTKTLKDKQECSENQNELKRSKEACKKEIKAFRKNLDAFLDKLEQDILAELDQHETKEHQRIQQQIATLSMALQTLDANDRLLNDAKKDGRKQAMFAADDVLASKDYQES